MDVLTQLRQRISAAEQDLLAAKRLMLQLNLGIDAVEACIPRDIAAIQLVVIEHYYLEPTAMTTQNRAQRLSQPRMIAMTLCRRLTRHSLEAVGLAFGGRDRGTVIHAERRVSELVGLEPEFAGDVVLIEAKARQAIEDQVKRLLQPAEVSA
jgi:chromosomal replication initiation ATPase DnaA